MRIIKIINVVMYFIIYAYSAYKTTVSTDTIWGWICTYIFVLFAIWGVTNGVKLMKRNNENFMF